MQRRPWVIIRAVQRLVPLRDHAATWKRCQSLSSCFMLSAKVSLPSSPALVRPPQVSGFGYPLRVRGLGLRA
jgi:hypothetical protein